MMQFEQLQLLPVIHKFEFSPFPWLYRHNYNNPAPEARGGRMSHFQLMTLTASYDATDPRDRIFALVGLARDASQDIIDYTKSHEEVLMDVAMRKFEHEGVAPHLNGIMPTWVVAKPDRLYELPSWVYDYQSVAKFQPFPLGFAQCLFKGEPEVRPNLRIESRFLHTGARVFDRLGTILQGQPWKKFVNPVDAPMARDGLVSIGVEPTHSYIAAMAEWISACQSLARTLGMYPKDAPRSVLSKHEKEEYGSGPRTATQVLWRALTCDKDKADGFRLHKQHGASFSAWVAWHRLAASCAVEANHVEGTLQERMRTNPADFELSTRYGPLYTTHSLPLPDLEVHENAFMFSASHFVQGAMLDVRLRSPNLRAGNPDEPLGRRLSRLSSIMTPFDSLYGQFCDGRKFSSTNIGYMGWVPEHAQEGDEICVFDGSRMLFVIRPVASDRGSRYKLVGTAYVHGLMYGGARAMGRGIDKIITLV